MDQAAWEGRICVTFLSAVSVERIMEAVHELPVVFSRQTVRVCMCMCAGKTDYKTL